MERGNTPDSPIVPARPILGTTCLFRTDPDSGELADEVARVREELRKLVGEQQQR